MGGFPVTIELKYNIPHTNFKVDGYDKKTNTVYEFLGDVFHGNPSKFDPLDTPHPYTDETAQKLYDDTFKRLDYIRNLGYNVIYIWENDYRNSTNLGGVKL